LQAVNDFEGGLHAGIGHIVEQNDIAAAGLLDHPLRNGFTAVTAPILRIHRPENHRQVGTRGLLQLF
jgi:hypothetical protein